MALKLVETIVNILKSNPENIIPQENLQKVFINANQKNVKKK